jgi:hypothetical protein
MVLRWWVSQLLGLLPRRAESCAIYVLQTHINTSTLQAAPEGDAVGIPYDVAVRPAAHGARRRRCCRVALLRVRPLLDALRGVL